MLSRNKTCSLVRWMKEALLCLCVLYILTQGKNWTELSLHQRKQGICVVLFTHRGTFPSSFMLDLLEIFKHIWYLLNVVQIWSFIFFHILGSLHTEERSRLVSMLEVRLCYGMNLLVHFILSISRELQIPASPYIAQKQPQHVLPLFQIIFGTY